MALARHIAVALALAASVATPSLAQEVSPTQGRSIKTLAHVPLQSRSGARITLGSRVRRGKPTLISIWSSWCLPCIAEARYLDRLRKELGSDFNFIYVNRMEGYPDPNQPPELTARFLANGGMTDVDYVTADVAASRQIIGGDVRDVPEGKVGVPRVYLFDRSGRQVYGHYGFSPMDSIELERQLRLAIAK